MLKSKNTNTKEYKKEYRQKNKAIIKEKMSVYYQENKEKIRQNAAIYREKNKEKVKEGKIKSYLIHKAKNIENEPLKLLFRNTRGRSQRRKQDFQLDYEFIKELWIKQKGKCYYTGISMECSYNKKSPTQVSIDRIDSEVGYTKENSVLCCLSINFAKNSFNEEEFMNFLKLLKN